MLLKIKTTNRPAPESGHLVALGHYQPAKDVITLYVKAIKAKAEQQARQTQGSVNAIFMDILTCVLLHELHHKFYHKPPSEAHADVFARKAFKALTGRRPKTGLLRFDRA